MDYFEKIQHYLERAHKLKLRAKDLETMENVYQGEEVHPNIGQRIQQAYDLAMECEKRAKHALYSARHEAYNEGWRSTRPAYRKRFSQDKRPSHV